MSGDWSRVYGVRWVHVFEEDTPAGSVFRPDSEDIPLSRRPRRGVELHRDGSATLFTAGPDDRMVGHPGTWRADGDARILEFHQGERGTARLRLVKADDARLVADPPRG